VFETQGGRTRGRRFLRTAGRFFARTEQAYGNVLGFALNHPIIILGAAGLILAGSLLLIPLVGVELMPATDESEVRVYAEMAMGTKLDVVDDTFKKIEAVVKQEVPEIKNTVAFIGGSSWRARGSNAGAMRIALQPVAQRQRSSEQIAADLRRKLKFLPGVLVRTRAGQGLFLLRIGTTEGDKVEVEVRGYDLEISDALARRIQEVVEDVDGITDVKISRETGTPEELIIVDRQKAADMKLTVSKIAKMLQTALSGTSAGFFRDGGYEYMIRVKLADADKKDLQEILDFSLTNTDSEPVVLRNVVHVTPRRGPVLIQRKGQERVVYVSANISGR
ncbi:MAG: efflux RND transporter permease subunit, partial [Desulfobacterales bacterium]|nr:efflux RND transporter permease subunit [Desulfobacterales bacterium]